MAKPIRIIKKYPNRRLYDTANSGYITLADVKQMVLEFIDFQVIDAKSGDDLTRGILLQIILEEESAGMPMFSSEMLSQMIRFYGNALQGIMGAALLISSCLVNKSINRGICQSIEQDLGLGRHPLLRWAQHASLIGMNPNAQNPSKDCPWNSFRD